MRSRRPCRAAPSAASASVSRSRRAATSPPPLTADPSSRSSTRWHRTRSPSPPLSSSPRPHERPSNGALPGMPARMPSPRTRQRHRCPRMLSAQGSNRPAKTRRQRKHHSAARRRPRHRHRASRQPPAVGPRSIRRRTARSLGRRHLFRAPGPARREPPRRRARLLETPITRRPRSRAHSESRGPFPCRLRFRHPRRHRRPSPRPSRRPPPRSPYRSRRRSCHRSWRSPPPAPASTS